MAEHVLPNRPTAEVSRYEYVDHVPHLEEPERFKRELAALTHRIRLRSTNPFPTVDSPQRERLAT